MFQSFCDYMTNLDNSTRDELYIKVTDSQPEIRCFPYDIQAWFDVSNSFLL